MPVIRYAALSKASDDPDQESIETQLDAIAGKLPHAHPEGFEIVGEANGRRFTDDGYSGSKRNRGPGLERAIDAAVRAADEHGEAELWANTSARFGRGTGRRDEARAIGELFYELRRKGVRLRAVQDDELVANEMLVGIGSTIAAKYSQDLSESVSRAKLRQLAKGDHLGGPLCDGYVTVREHDEHGKVIGRTFEFDGERAELWRSIFALADEGVPDTIIARRKNKEGKRTKRGRPFDRRAIQSGLTNPWYAGRIAYKRGTPDEQIVEGRHPALVDPAVFDRIQRARIDRDHAKPHEKVIGRPAQNHALARLARCARCGERLYARTSTYTRKDGSRARTYVCGNYIGSTGLCDSKPIDAEVVDAAVIAELDKLLVDFDGWRRRIESGHVAERARLADEIQRAERDLDAQADRLAKVEAKWGEYVAEGDDHKADLVLPMVERERDALGAAERRLTAATDALATVPTETPADAMLDFANGLQEAIRGRLDATASMAEVNQALRELFEDFLIHETAWAGFEDGEVVWEQEGRRAFLVQPILRIGIAHRIADDWPKLIEPGDDAPPLRWLMPSSPSGPTPSEDPDGNLHNTQL